MRITKLLACSAIFACLLLTGPVSAKDKKGVLEGEYIPVDGWAKSMEVSRPELGELPNQLGTFKIKLERLGWSELPKEDKKRIAKKVLIEGVFKGVFNPNFTLNHTLSNQQRSGIMYTQGDFLIPTQGDLFCASGVPLKGTEQLNFVSGIGEYAGLTTGTIYLTAVVNNCLGEPEFLQNDFKIDKNVGALVFAPQ
jgi:hypothetical protein